jgi:hypothetical protein
MPGMRHRIKDIEAMKELHEKEFDLGAMIDDL